MRYSDGFVTKALLALNTHISNVYSFSDLKFIREERIKAMVGKKSLRRPCQCEERKQKIISLPNLRPIFLASSDKNSEESIYPLPFFATGWMVRDCLIPRIEVVEIPIIDALSMKKIEKTAYTKQSAGIFNTTYCSHDYTENSNISKLHLEDARNSICLDFFDRTNSYGHITYTAIDPNFLKDIFKESMSEREALINHRLFEYTLASIDFALTTTWEENTRKIIPLRTGNRFTPIPLVSWALNRGDIKPF